MFDHILQKHEENRESLTKSFTNVEQGYKSFSIVHENIEIIYYKASTFSSGWFEGILGMEVFFDEIQQILIIIKMLIL